ncbi:putative acetyltransferase [compost metagenome]
MFVAKQFQGQGIGKKLIGKCKARYSSLALDVYVKNASAVQFYKNCGFEIEQTKQNEDTGEVEYSMKWKA